MRSMYRDTVYLKHVVILKSSEFEVKQLVEVINSLMQFVVNFGYKKWDENSWFTDVTGKTETRKRRRNYLLSRAYFFVFLREVVFLETNDVFSKKDVFCGGWLFEENDSIFFEEVLRKNLC